MKTTKTRTQGKPGRKSTKRRINISLSEVCDTAAEHLGLLTFGNKTAYLEHLILNDLKAHNMTLADIIKLAEEWQEKKGKRGIKE